MDGEEAESSSGRGQGDPNGPREKEKCDPAEDECLICFQPITFRTEVPGCRHSFCFLCIKGVALRKGSCPLCRRPIPVEIFRDPKLAEPFSEMVRGADDEDGPAGGAKRGDLDEEKGQWFYEARRGGWWRYDPRQEAAIETAFVAGEESTNLLIAGYMYCIDFLDMCQYRKDIDRAARWERAIKRTLKSAGGADMEGAVKGIAGLRSATGASRVTDRDAATTDKK